MKHASDNMHVIPPDPAPNKRLYFKVGIGESIYELDVKNKEFGTVTGILDVHTRNRMITARDGCWYCVAKSPDIANDKFTAMAIQALERKDKK